VWRAYIMLFEPRQLGTPPPAAPPPPPAADEAGFGWVRTPRLDSVSRSPFRGQGCNRCGDLLVAQARARPRGACGFCGFCQFSAPPLCSSSSGSVGGRRGSARPTRGHARLCKPVHYFASQLAHYLRLSSTNLACGPPAPEHVSMPV
jgi:hypothetical protein